MAAFRTSLTGWEPLIRDHERPTVPFAFVSETANNLAPSCLRDVTGEIPILLHVLHREVLDHDHVKFFDEPCGQLLDEVFAAVLNALVDLRHAFALPLPVIRAFLFPRELLLLAAKPLLFVFKPTRIPGLLARRERHETFDAQVYSDEFKVAALSVDSRELADFLCADEADVILSCGVLRDCATTWLGRKLPRPPDVDKTRHLRKTELLFPVLFSNVEGRANVPGGLVALLRFEGRILSPALKEIGKRLIQIPKALLERDGTDFRQPLGFFFPFFVGQTAREVRERK
ncbi:hypothetical protein GGP85_001841 [Salinibacter ruber]|nr:hypothetical protein [Salinibacter ruber]MCS3826388.1 hypothetical protein [Salinibacter ruber]